MLWGKKNLSIPGEGGSPTFHLPLNCTSLRSATDLAKTWDGPSPVLSSQDTFLSTDTRFGFTLNPNELGLRYLLL